MILLGSTGSIGTNTLAIARRFNLNIDVLVAGKSIDKLNEQIKEFSPRMVVIAHKQDCVKVNHSQVLYGEEGILEAIESSESSLVINSLVGFLGLKPTLKAIECGKKVALANKESLVAAGAFIDISKIQPIDSEHFGLWYLLNDKRPVKKMIITASGGAFRNWPLDKLQNATLQDALKHPNWSMGQKITIDSASMVNKTFELLEARWLFGEGDYDAIIETKSLIHALIDFKDGSTTAHFAHADMKLPISYAIMGKVEEEILKPINLVEVGSLEFREIKKERYPIWEIKDSLLKNPKRGLVVNAANEAAIELFIEGKCSFLDISKKIIQAYGHFDNEAQSLDEVFELDTEVRAYVKQS
ncbi:1-deoxy-D-xylulose-5-phosphate reductoisomerase [Sulfurimonas sp. MAG313]|nr:1-deoxy-D-xylulose-5-phosphate reductoisomerase [Sulfurimonas sp. MAG313]MDF1880422.1 1-deoxy-D-xylulose-5-phosphate reductoisomerase [Sulfurimonas sp. MAG313]